MKILAIETSCDETSVAIIEGSTNSLNSGVRVLSNVIFSQIPYHRLYGGVVPEVASRNHLLKINSVLKEAILKTGFNNQNIKDFLNSIDAIAVTVGPGLVGSLLVGVGFAKALAYASGKPLIPVNHIEGHIYANFISEFEDKKFKIPSFPFLGLIISGGHTILILVEDHFRYQILGQTLDDAVGEAFDKVGKMLGLSYPAGPEIEKLAFEGNPAAFAFPRPLIKENNFNFSFSGLKTAVLYTLKNQKLDLEKRQVICDLAASFQQAVIDVLVSKTQKAAQKYKIFNIVVSGGVAANKTLRKAFVSAFSKQKAELFFPENILCTDNAAMIGAAAFYSHFLREKKIPFSEIEASPNLYLK